MKDRLNDLGRGFARGIDAALTRREGPQALGLLRIALASVLLVSLLSHLGAVGEYFSDESLIGGRFARLAFPDRVSLFLPARKGHEEAWYAALYVADPTLVRAIFGLGVLAHLSWVLGLFTWISGLVCLGLWISLVGRNPMLYAYPDQLALMLTFLLAIVPSGRGLSLDAKWRKKGGSVPVWCRRIFQLQLAIVYLSTGLAKHGPTWHADGTAIYYTLSNPYNRHFAWTGLWASLQPYLLRPATWAVLVWEISFALFVVQNWLREMFGRRRGIWELRYLWLGVGLTMHLGIALLLYTVLFSYTICAAYLCFLKPDEAQGVVDRIKAVVARLAPASR